MHASGLCACGPKPSRGTARRNRRGVVMQIYLSALFAMLVSPAPSSPSDLVPFVLKAELQGMPFGLLYTPEVLAALVANKPPDTIPPRIAEAIRNGDAIVV